MNKIICCFSNFIIQYLRILLAQILYRSIGNKTLIILIGLSIMPLAIADNTEETWPEPVYFPQKQTTPDKPANPKPEKEDGKKWFWPFGDKASKEASASTQPPSNLKTGPKDPPASPYPLIRIPMTFQANQGTIPSGIYLLKPSPCGHEASTDKTTITCFSLTQRNNRLLVFQTHPVSLPDINLSKEGTPSPLSKTDLAKSDSLTAKVKLSPDQKTLSLQIQQGQNTLESEDFPVFVDQRTILSY